MQVILLSGGSGMRLWPLSNGVRSKQFLKLLDVDGSGKRESMVQRVMRQLRASGISSDITIATSESQRDSVIAQLGTVNIVTEPSRRDTFPAICLACEYLSKVKDCYVDEVVVVMPCDPYTEIGYYECIKQMADGIDNSLADLMVMGISPTYPSSKYGYVLPESIASTNGVLPIKCFIEKPDIAVAENLIQIGARWNGGVFVFKLGYITDIAEKYVKGKTYDEIIEHYNEFPKISFDYEVAEKAKNVGMVEYNGEWKDLGTWNALTEELSNKEYGHVITDGTRENTHVLNELDIPLLCLGTKNLIVAASPDGIIVSEKGKSENIKTYADMLKQRPMFEERRWGTYRVIDSISLPDGYCALTKRLTINPGCSISYQRHSFRDEVWTFVSGEGEIVVDGKRDKIGPGKTVVISKGVKHAIRAKSLLIFIEVQSGRNLVEEDIERFPFDW